MNKTKQIFMAKKNVSVITNMFWIFDHPIPIDFVVLQILSMYIIEQEVVHKWRHAISYNFRHPLPHRHATQAIALSLNH